MGNVDNKKNVKNEKIEKNEKSKNNENNKKFKSGFVTIVGRTNVGKSTILNALLGEKVAAVVNKPETTRTAIKGIINRENSQIIFTDTPGIHKPKTKYGEALNDTAYSYTLDGDIILFVIDATLDFSKGIDKGNLLILEKIKEGNNDKNDKEEKNNKKVILLINKIDLVKDKNEILNIIELFNKEYDFCSVIPISSIGNFDKKYKEEILKEIENNLDYGPMYYDSEEYTDQTLRELVQETVREKSLMFLKDEVPHGIYVECTKMKKSKTRSNESIFNVDCTIYCIRDSHKGIIIGKNGLMLKKIGSSSRIELEKILGCKVNLKLTVKVDKNWQDNAKAFNKLLGK